MSAKAKKNNTSHTAAPRLATSAARATPARAGASRSPGRQSRRHRRGRSYQRRTDPVQGGDYGEGGDHGRGRPQDEGPQVPCLGHPTTMGLGGQCPETEPGHGQGGPTKAPPAV